MHSNATHATHAAAPRFAATATDALARVGPALFGAALVGFGLLCVLTGAPVPGLEPLPAGVPAPRVWAYLSGLALLAGGAAAVTSRRASRGPLVATGALFLAWVLGLHLPALLTHLTNGSKWTATFEAAALGGAAWALAQAPGAPAAAGTVAAGTVADATRPTALGTAGRLAFGVALVVFGGLHLVYRDFVALLVPAWIPAKLFWAVFTGVAHLAAGLGLLTGVLARPAAAWIGAMFGTWVLIVHAPRVLRTPGDPKEWASLFVALGMCGGAWLLAGRLPRRAAGRAASTATAPIHVPSGGTAHGQLPPAPRAPADATGSHP